MGARLLRQETGPAQAQALAIAEADGVSSSSGANVDGVANPSQPKGSSYFAPDASQLEAVFNQIAQDLLVRISQ